MKQSKRKREAANDVGVVAPVEPAVSMQAPHTQVANAESDAKRAAAMSVYKLAPSCTVRDCAPLKMALSDLIDIESEAILDVSAIERIDTAVLQLLYAFVRDRKALNRKVLWQGSSECFAEAVHLLGLGAQLDVPPAVSFASGATL